MERKHRKVIDDLNSSLSRMYRSCLQSLAKIIPGKKGWRFKREEMQQSRVSVSRPQIQNKSQLNYAFIIPVLH